MKELITGHLNLHLKIAKLCVRAAKSCFLFLMHVPAIIFDRSIVCCVQHEQAKRMSKSPDSQIVRKHGYFVVFGFYIFLDEIT